MLVQFKDEAEIAQACASVLAIAPPAFPVSLPPSASSQGEPEWYSFEHTSWKIGEEIRQAFVRHPWLKKQTQVMTDVLQVAVCANLRRGRQSFIMALGYIAARPHAESLVHFIDDPDVCGHVLSSLLKMHADGYVDQVRPLLNSKKTWIRNLAKRYVQRYPAS